MFKLPDGIPTLSSSSQDWTDYAEYKALKKGSIALLDLIKPSLLISDEITVNGIEDDTDKFINKVDGIALEIKDRILYTKNQYPFELLNNGYVLKYIPDENLYTLIYRFLLLATRLKMSNQKIQNGLDGTFLFESLSAQIALSFLGRNAQVDVLGTSKNKSGGFREKLFQIFKKIGEGTPLHQNDYYKPQDDNVDVIAWKGFADKKESQLIAFGQCKTGTSWQNSLSDMNIEAFCKRWFTKQPVLTPLNMFFSAQYFPKEIWRERAYEAGLVFDRFRIIDYLPTEITDELLKDIKIWCTAAEKVFD